MVCIVTADAKMIYVFFSYYKGYIFSMETSRNSVKRQGQ